MVQSGVRTSELVRVIGHAPRVSFNLAPSDMDLLLRAGVTDDTIKLMAARELGLVQADNIRIASGNSGWPGTTGRLRNAIFNPEDQTGTGPGGAGLAGREPLIVPESTPVRLRLTRNLSSAGTRTDDIIRFEVLEDVTVRNRIGNFVVIQRGATAYGTITDAAPKRTMGRGGKVEVTIDSVMLADGDKLELRAVTAGERHGRVGVMVGLMVPTAFVDLPAAPFLLFMHGKTSTIKDGFDMTAYTDGAANLDSLDFQRR